MAGIFPPHFLGVKNLVDHGVDKVPPIYVRSDEERAVPVRHDENFPVLDLSAITTSRGRAALVAQIGDACEQWGFFQVINHGVPETVVDEMLGVAREFHALPNEEKMRYFSTDISSRMRYGTSFNVSQDRVLSWRDFLRHSCLPLSEMRDLWPDKPESYRRITAEYSTQVLALGKLILELVSESLGLRADYINTAFNGFSQVMALNFYPACPEPDLALGIAAHSDPGSVTILLQDHVQGLQVMHSQEWYSVKPIPYSFVVNVGDQIQILSNDKYKSAEHRAVVNSRQDRMSIPVALGPSWESLVQPAPELLGEDQVPVFKPVVYRDYMLAMQGSPLNRQWVLDSFRIGKQ